MRLKPELRGHHVTAEQILNWFMTIMVMLNIGLGTAILVSGPTRFATPAFKPLVDLVNGGTWFWGVSAFLAGSLIAFPDWLAQVVGLWIAMCWHFTWMACFIVAVVTIPGSAMTGIPAYGAFAFIHVVLLAIKVLVHPRELQSEC